ncbi:MAG: carbohydrate kinase family protein [Bacteroides sp.]|jgi:sugar/nucleoside kinase (ribokinase family)|nr:carbohydrate kinase family protein [Bacteroides sp.]
MTEAHLEDFPRFVIAGRLDRDTILPISGPANIDVLGGNLAYAAVGLNLWGQTAGLLARVGNEFPLDWLKRFETLGFDLNGIKILSETIDHRRFLAHTDATTTHTQNPVQHFADRGLAYPPFLLDYTPKKPDADSRKTPSSQSIHISDIPKHFLEASAVHICPIDYVSHMILPSIFHQGQATTITLTSNPGYMSPSFWEEIPSLLSGLTAFITQENEIRQLFQGRQTDLWEMAGILGDHGPEFILIQTPSRVIYLYDQINQRRWIVPNYPGSVVDPTGAKDAFAGGFLAGYRKFYDPLEATLLGNISTSLVVEGSGVFYALNTMPGLPEARLKALRELVRAA